MRLDTYRMRRNIKTGPKQPYLLPLLVIVLIWVSFPAPLYSGGRQEQEDTSIQVFVSIAPQAYLLQRISGDRISVGTLVEEGQDPHTFDPTPSVMARLSETELYFRIGVEFEDVLLERIKSTAPSLEIIDCRENITLREIDDTEDGSSHGRSENGHDPHIWMSIRNAVTISNTIYTALVELDPEGKDIYEAGHSSLVEDLSALDEELKHILQPVKGKKLFVFHPTFGYFADDYDLQQVPVELGGNEPSAHQLAGIIDAAKAENARVIFVQPQFSQKSAQAVADAIGGAVVPINSLALDYVENMKAIALAIKEGLP